MIRYFGSSEQTARPAPLTAGHFLTETLNFQTMTTAILTAALIVAAIIIFYAGVDHYVLRTLSRRLCHEKTRRSRKLDVEFSEWAERYRSKDEDEDEDF